MRIEAVASDVEAVEWLAVPSQATALAEKLAGLAAAVKRAAYIYTSVPLGVYCRLGDELLGVYRTEGATDQDFTLTKSAVSHAGTVCPVSVGLGELSTGDWVKLAYTSAYGGGGSPGLRRAGELLNFFPGTYPGGIPNYPRPAMSMLTSGLVGAGLGYGAGWLGEQLLPRKWERGHLRRTLGLLGGAAGAGLGAAPGLSNLSTGRPFNAPSPFAQPFNAEPEMNAGALHATLHPDELSSVPLGGQYRQACDAYAAAFGEVVEQEIKEAMDDASVPDQQVEHGSGPLDVDIDSLGRTLWETGASPQTAGVTVGALAAAQQMPGGNRPGWVTPAQMGNLAARMGAGYVSGALVGSALGLLTGMPEATQEKLRQSGMYVALVNAVIPKLFGG